MMHRMDRVIALTGIGVFHWEETSCCVGAVKGMLRANNHWCHISFTHTHPEFP